jgi:arginase
MDILIYAGNAGDRNERGMSGAASLGAAIAERLGIAPEMVGSCTGTTKGGWRAQLAAATPNLRRLATTVRAHLARDSRFILTMGRCAAGIATLPLIAERFPDAVIVWFDAHGDSNAPSDQGVNDDSYLGGMVLTGGAGEWDTGFGGGVDLTNVILVGARDLDPPELTRIESGQLKLVKVGPDLGARLTEAIGERQVYVHLDCDVLDAGLIATEYQSPEGLSFSSLRDAFRSLASHEVVGLEIAEYENCWPDGRMNSPRDLIDAIDPLLMHLSTERHLETGA